MNAAATSDFRKKSDVFVRGSMLTLLAFLAAALLYRIVAVPLVSVLPQVAHAGGMAGGLTYTNSIAALDDSYAKGFRLFEVDFQTTSDGHDVCGHDWKAFDKVAPTLANFIEWRRTQPIQPCLMDELHSWMRSHPDARLVSDVKTDAVRINHALFGAIGSQLIIQAYNAPQLCEFAAAGVKDIILTLHMVSYTYWELFNQLGEPCLATYSPIAVTMDLERIAYGHALITRAMTGLPVYAHTMNNCLTHSFARLLGADATYSDVLAGGDCSL
jgi:hypothetical protein